MPGGRRDLAPCEEGPARAAAFAPTRTPVTVTQDRSTALPVRTPEPPSTARTALILGAFVAIGPLTIDMYLPALPTIATDLSTSAATVQLTLTGTLVGLALGQLVL